MEQKHGFPVRRRFPDWRGKRPGFRATEKEYREYVRAGNFVGLMHMGTPLEIQDYCYSKMRKWWRIKEPFEALWYDLKKRFPALRRLERFAAPHLESLTSRFWWLSKEARARRRDERKTIKIRTEMTAGGCYAGPGSIDKKYLAKLLRQNEREKRAVVKGRKS
ncbi:MAG: hypothetical protein Pg6C_04060 [Treponemataceae bacterium]|nr:MAG: hypothetical protein Pg6C_04000 [Treponemataceae bacterium]GMO42525.1 MAG: hypothetical protein Pg6C_04060 [Treponemataceae bacterium]